MRHRVRPVAVTLVLTVGLAGCTTSGSENPESRGVRARAIEQLRTFGLPAGQARCVVDALGAETVAATSEMEVLASGQPYQDAVKGCPA